MSQSEPVSQSETSVDPLTGEPVRTLEVSDRAAVDAAVEAARSAAPALAAAAPAERASWLDRAADSVESAVTDLVALARRETGLPEPRLRTELARCATQLRFYAGVARDGGFLDVAIDLPADRRSGDGPAPTVWGAPIPDGADLRRMRVPLGPVAVFGASNFPFAFGSVGNDTAAAIAAGCPVVVKGHPAHLGTHELLTHVVTEAVRAAGAPGGTLGAVTGFDAGTTLVRHPGIRAVAFTGSQRGGLALHAAASSRAVGIPVFAEMGTVNPVVVTRAGAGRAAEIAAGCVASFTLGMGQYCTKPGLLLAPQGSGLDLALGEALQQAAPRGPLLTHEIAGSYAAGVDRLLVAGAEMVTYVPEPGPGSSVAAVVLSARPAIVRAGSSLVEECFGPVLIVVEYADDLERDDVIEQLQGTLAATVAGGGPDDPETAALVGRLTGLAGRVIVDGWPTSVPTTWAQHHGGPWPSTTVPSATSVGAAALDRFTRPVAFQGVPAAALPPALADENPWGLPRRVDGVLEPRRPAAS